MDTSQLCSPTHRRLKARVCRITARSTNLLSFLLPLGKSCTVPCRSSCQPLSWGWSCSPKGQQQGPRWPCLLRAAQAGPILSGTKFHFLLGANELVRICGERSVLTLITTLLQSSNLQPEPTESGSLQASLCRGWIEGLGCTGVWLQPSPRAFAAVTWYIELWDCRVWELFISCCVIHPLWRITQKSSGFVLGFCRCSANTVRDNADERSLGMCTHRGFVRRPDKSIAMN